MITIKELDFTPTFTFTPAEEIDPVVNTEGDNIVITYAVRDDSPSDWGSPMEDNEGVIFREFTSESERDEFIAWQTEDDKNVAFIVDHYEHSGSHYSLHDTVAYQHGAWDTKPSCVLVLSKEFEAPEGAAESILMEYNSYVAGEVYGIVMETFTPEGEQVECDAVWGLIGTDYAEKTVMQDAKNQL